MTGARLVRAPIGACLLVAFLLGAFAVAIRGEQKIDEAMVARIKAEAFQRSQVLNTLTELTDMYGPRLRGSPAYAAAADWVKQRLADWGFERVWFEPGGFPGPGWSATRFTVEMTSPSYLHAIAQPLAWSPSTNGRLSGTPVLVDVSTPADFPKYRGRLKGAIVLNGRPHAAPAASAAAALTRFTDEELARGAAAIDPAQQVLATRSGLDYAGTERERRDGIVARAVIAKFFRDEGAAAVLVPSPLPSGVITATDAGGFDVSGPNWKIPNPNLTVPSFVLAREHFNRIGRLVERAQPVHLEVQLEAEILAQVRSLNILAELHGSDPKLQDEIVMIGGHFDSWHTGSGATDNAAGSVVMMEALRILKAVGATPRRTVRLALWDAEEGGHIGSQTYVRNHFGDPKTMTFKPEHATLAAYFNLDNGTGKIRGVFLQGNELVRPIFEEWLKPFASLGAATLAVQRVGGTDHLDFDHVGLPAFQFIQDPIDYETRTHHTNMDTLESIYETDLQQAAAIVAAFAYQAAMRDEKLPRMTVLKPSL
jgi:hypothetical protein